MRTRSSTYRTPRLRSCSHLRYVSESQRIPKTAKSFAPRVRVLHFGEDVMPLRMQPLYEVLRCYRFRKTFVSGFRSEVETHISSLSPLQFEQYTDDESPPPRMHRNMFSSPQYVPTRRRYVKRTQLEVLGVPVCMCVCVYYTMLEIRTLKLLRTQTRRYNTADPIRDAVAERCERMRSHRRGPA